jgi:hypothetical protein
LASSVVIFGGCGIAATAQQAYTKNAIISRIFTLKRYPFASPQSTSLSLLA